MVQPNAKTMIAIAASSNQNATFAVNNCLRVMPPNSLLVGTHCNDPIRGLAL